jgi:hypothetical protein
LNIRGKKESGNNHHISNASKVLIAGGGISDREDNLVIANGNALLGYNNNHSNS